MTRKEDILERIQELMDELNYLEDEIDDIDEKQFDDYTEEDFKQRIDGIGINSPLSTEGTWEPVQLHIQEGDIIFSLKGILMSSALDKRKQVVRSVKLRGVTDGEGFFQMVGDMRRWIE